jgi:hypothetical protein
MATAPQQNLVNLYAQQNPDFALQQLQTERQQRIADMLTQEGAAPINYDKAGAISWTQGLAKMLQAYSGRTQADEAIKTQAALNTQAARGAMASFGMGEPSQPSGQALGAAMSPDSAPQAAQPSNAPPLNPYGAPPLVAYMASQGDPAAKAQLDHFLKEKQTPDSIKLNKWAGITPAQENAKNTTLMVKPNNSLVGLGADGKPSLNFVAPDVEGNLQSSVGPNGQITASGIPGVVPARAALESGLAGAKANQAIGMVTDATGAQVPTRMGVAADAGQAQLGLTNRGNVNLSPDMQAAIRADASANGIDSPQVNINANAANGARPGQTVGMEKPRLGVDPTIQTARTNQQTAMADKWKPLNEAASNAQTINSRLDTIKDLSTKASTGQMADKIQFANSLLALAGSERANTSSLGTL